MNCNSIDELRDQVVFSDAGAQQAAVATADWSWRDGLLRVLGWRAALIHGDPCVVDRWLWLRRHLRAGGLRTLDAGSGAGAYTMFAAALGNEAIGISFDAAANRRARRRAQTLNLTNVRFVDADLRDLASYAAVIGPVDQIICAETVEHIKDDKRLIGDLASLLRPGGKLFLTTPNEKHRHMVGDTVSVTEDGGHVRWGYTHNEMSELLTEAGLVVIVEDFVSGLVSQQITNAMRALSKVNGRLAWLAAFPLRAFQMLDRPVTWITGYPFLCIAVVAVKREAGPG